MAQNADQTGLIVLSAASILSAVLGSIHAFSVFLMPLETQFNASRSLVSLSYSMALITLTLAVLFGPRIYSRFSGAKILFAAGVLAGLGALIAGFSTTLWGVWLGYSVIFGAANGLGYGYGLQISAQMNPTRSGFAMGVVTAAYALGAVLSPALFEWAILLGGFLAAMLVLASALFGAAILGAALMARANGWFQGTAPDQMTYMAPIREQILLWLGYFGAVLAGLMIIGHAAGVAASAVGNQVAWIAPVIIAFCNLLGSLLGGRLVDQNPSRRVLIGLATITGFSLTGLAVFGTGFVLFALLGCIGFAYGGTIAAFPSAIAKHYGIENSPHIYGRVFTAWGAAGLLGPWLAGLLFDRSGGYDTAILVAAVCALLSILAIARAFRTKPRGL